MAKQKLPTVSIKDYDELNQRLYEKGQLEAKVSKSEAVMNERINALKKKFEDETSEQRTSIMMIDQQIQDFMLVHKSDFDKERSKVFAYGKVGFRTNPPKVAQLSRKYTVATSLELLKRLFAGKYTRQKEEINKDAILTDYSSKLLDDNKLAAAGLRIDQDETAFVEINWDEINKEAAA